MDWEPWIRFVHVLAALVWVGGGVMLSLVGLRARRSGDLAVIGEFTRTLSYVGLRVFTPAVVLVLATGLWLVLAGSAWRITQLWILLGLGTFGLAFVVGAIDLRCSAVVAAAAPWSGNLPPAF